MKFLRVRQQSQNLHASHYDEIFFNRLHHNLLLRCTGRICDFILCSLISFTDLENRDGRHQIHHLNCRYTGFRNPGAIFLTVTLKCTFFEFFIVQIKRTFTCTMSWAYFRRRVPFYDSIHWTIELPVCATSMDVAVQIRKTVTYIHDIYCIFQVTYL